MSFVIDKHSLSEYSDENCFKIPAYAFLNNTELSIVSLKNCSSVGNGAFKGCVNLAQVDLENCFGVGEDAFYSCNSLSELNLPNAITFNSNAIQFASNLKVLRLPAVQSLILQSQNNCNNLEELYLDNASSLTLRSLPNLKKLYCPNVQFLLDSAVWSYNNLYQLPKLKYLNLDNMYVVGGFANISTLEEVHISNARVITANLSGRFSELEIPECIRAAAIASPRLSYLSAPKLKYAVGINGNISAELFLPELEVATHGFTASYVYAPKCRYFSGAIGLVSFVFHPDILSTIHSGMFAGASFSSIDLGSCDCINSLGFKNCKNLTEISMSNVYYIGAMAFSSCSLLSYVNLTKCASIDSGAFWGCTVLESVYLPASYVCKLADVSVFYGTPISNSSFLGRFGSIYVPASLVEIYKTSNFWSFYSSRITSILEE